MTQETPTYDPTSEWVPCSTGLPANPGNYLCFMAADKEIIVANYNPDKIPRWYFEEWIVHPTHWRVLPDPPEVT